MPEYHITSMGERETMPMPPGVSIADRSAGEGTPQPYELRETAIEFDDISKTFHASGRKVKAIDSVTLRVSKGEIVALLGPNGAGKTTLIKMLCGLLTPDSGVLRIGGHNAARRPQVRRKLGVSLEGNSDFYSILSARENLEYFSGLIGMSARERAVRVERIMAELGIGRLGTARAGTLSKGQKQRLSLALSVVHDPDFIALDEPTLGLDPPAVEDFCALLLRMRKSGIGVLLASHDLATVDQVADRVALIAGGRLRYEERLEAADAATNPLRSDHLRLLYKTHVGA
jgi:ABC-type multidrug transport system ATPase subunit